jgi:uncharacterized protein
MSQDFMNGVEYFNRQFFFEAHDVWEELWRETQGTLRLFYQGLIQAAVGLYHLSNGNYKGACSQLTKSIGKLEQFQPVCDGLDVLALITGIQVCLDDSAKLLRGELVAFDETKIPQIVLTT